MNIAVNRSSIRDSHKAYRRAQTDLTKGISIAIFPEATIPGCAPTLGPFKTGAFKLAIEQQVPIVPITFLDNWKIFPDHGVNRFLVRPGFCRIIIHKPIPTIGMTEENMTELRQRVHDLISKTLKDNDCLRKGC